MTSAIHRHRCSRRWNRLGAACAGFHPAGQRHDTRDADNSGFRTGNDNTGVEYSDGAHDNTGTASYTSYTSYTGSANSGCSASQYGRFHRAAARFGQAAGQRDYRKSSAGSELVLHRSLDRRGRVIQRSAVRSDARRSAGQADCRKFHPTRREGGLGSSGNQRGIGRAALRGVVERGAGLDAAHAGYCTAFRRQRPV